MVLSCARFDVGFVGFVRLPRCLCVKHLAPGWNLLPCAAWSGQSRLFLVDEALSKNTTLEFSIRCFIDVVDMHKTMADDRGLSKNDALGHT